MCRVNSSKGNQRETEHAAYGVLSLLDMWLLLLLFSGDVFANGGRATRYHLKRHST